MRVERLFVVGLLLGAAASALPPLPLPSWSANRTSWDAGLADYRLKVEESMFRWNARFDCERPDGGSWTRARSLLYRCVDRRLTVTLGDGGVAPPVFGELELLGRDLALRQRFAAWSARCASAPGDTPEEVVDTCRFICVRGQRSVVALTKGSCRLAEVFGHTEAELGDFPPSNDPSDEAPLPHRPLGDFPHDGSDWDDWRHEHDADRQP
jgi:hypothetical protein